MANVYKVGDLVQGKSKTLKNINGSILGIDVTGKSKMFRVLFADGVERVVGSRSIEIRGVAAPLNHPPLVLRICSTPGNAHDIGNGSEDDFYDNSDEESSVDPEDIAPR
jgi:hypothetical protein